jgi:hypothetical protein
MRFLANLCGMVLLACSLLLVACGSGGGKTDAGTDNGGGKTLADLVPKSNEITGWAEDTSGDTPGTPAGPQLAVTLAEATELVDGHADLFYQTGCKGVALEFYINGTHTLRLEIFELNDAAGAKAIYDNTTVKGLATWETLTLGDESRIYKSNATTWKMHAHKKQYFINIPESITGTDDPGKTLATDFLTAVLAKI